MFALFQFDGIALIVQRFFFIHGIIWLLSSRFFFFGVEKRVSTY